MPSSIALGCGGYEAHMYAEYRKLRDEAQELLIAQSNIGSIYDFSDGKFRRQEEKEQKR